MRVKTFAKILTLAAVLGGGVARAQNGGGDIDLDSFRPAMDSRGYVTVNASQLLGNFEVSFGLVTDWGHNVLKLHGGPFTGAGYASGDSEYRVENVISPTLQAAFGLGGFFEIGVSLPFRVVSGTWNPDFIGDPSDPRDNDQF